MPGPVTAFILLGIGLAGGLAGGMLGIGGSLVMIPALDFFFGPDQHLYQAAAMIVNFFVVVPAVVQHRRAKAIDAPTVARLIPLAAVSVIAGVILSELPVFAGGNEVFLRGLFGLFLAGVCILDGYRLLRPAPVSPPAVRLESNPASLRTLTWQRSAWVAVPTGLVAGLLGVGGGVIAVPLQRKLLRLPMRTAIANSATVIIATSVVGATAKNYAYFVGYENGLRPAALAALLILPAIVGSAIGSRLTHRLPVAYVKLAFACVLVVAAVRLIHPAMLHTLR